MSKNPKPTEAELKFIFGLILQGYDDADILEEYGQQYEAGTLMFPYRTDKRFIRERRRELEAAKTVLEEHIKKRVDPLVAQSRKEHFNHLAEIATLLLDGGFDKITDTEPASEYEIINEEYTSETLTHNQLIGTLESNLDIAIQRYGGWEVFDCLGNHLEAVYPGCQGLYKFINDHPLKYIDILRTLAHRKMFIGTCPVCKDW